MQKCDPKLIAELTIVQCSPGVRRNFPPSIVPEEITQLSIADRAFNAVDTAVLEPNEDRQMAMFDIFAKTFDVELT